MSDENDEIKNPPAETPAPDAATQTPAPGATQSVQRTPEGDEVTLDLEEDFLSAMDKNASKVFITDEEKAEQERLEKEAKEKKDKEDADAAAALESEKEEKEETAEETPAGDLSETPAAEEQESSQSTETPAVEDNKDLDDLEKGLGPHANPKVKESFKALRKVVESSRLEGKAAKDKAAELETQVNELRNRSMAPEVEQELAALRERDRSYQVENSVHIQENFDKKIQSNNVEIVDILRTFNFGLNEDKTKNGADEKLLASGPITRETLAKTFPGDRWEKFRTANPDEADMIESLARGNAVKVREKASEIKKLKENYETTTKKAREDYDLQQKETTEQVTKRMDAQLVKRGTGLEWIKRATLDAKDTPEIKAKKEAHNKFLDEINVDLKAKMNIITSRKMEDVEKLVDVAVDATFLKKREQELKDERAKSKRLEAEIARLKGVAPSSTPTLATKPPVVDGKAAADKKLKENLKTSRLGNEEELIDQAAKDFKW